MSLCVACSAAPRASSSGHVARTPQLVRGVGVIKTHAPCPYPCCFRCASCSNTWNRACEPWGVLRACDDRRPIWLPRMLAIATGHGHLVPANQASKSGRPSFLATPRYFSFLQLPTVPASLSHPPHPIGSARTGALSWMGVADGQGDREGGAHHHTAAHGGGFSPVVALYYRTRESFFRAILSMC